MALSQIGALFEERPAPGTKTYTAYYLCIPIGVRIQVLTIVDEHYYCIVVPIIVSARVTGPRYKHTDLSILV